jgi:hypothetical protein
MISSKQEAFVSARNGFFIVAVAALALLLRLLLIRYVAMDAGDDLRIYTYFGDLMSHGANPYNPPADSPINRHYANIAPLNLAFFATILRLWDSPTALRVTFAVVDALVLLTVGFLVRRPWAWRRDVMLFYAFNPLILITMVVNSQDKVVVLWLMVLLLVAVEANRVVASIALTTVLTLYRWLGAFFILPLSLYFARSWRALIMMLGSFGAALAVSHLFYWPDNLIIYASRSARTLIDPPIHASPTILLDAIGYYSPTFVPVSIFVALAVAYALFAFEKIGIVELIVLVTFFTNMSAPELPVSRILMVALPLLWIIRLPAERVWVLWIVATAATFFVRPELGQTVLASLPAAFQPTMAWLLSPVPNALIMNTLPALLLVWYCIDKATGRVRLPRLSHSPAQSSLRQTSL